MRSALALVLAAAPLAVWAQAPTNAEAKKHLEQGLRYFNVQSYFEAIDEFRKGYEIDPAPDFLYALGQAQRLSGDCAKANLSYQAFLRSRPAAKRAAPAQQNIARCMEELAHSSTPPAPATPAAPEPTPTAPAQERPPPPQPPPPVLLPAPAVPPPAATSVESGSPWYTDGIGDGLAILGAASAVTGLVLLGVGASQVSSANTAGSNATSYSAFASSAQSASSGDTLQKAGVAVAIAGGAVFGLGIVRYLVRDSGAKAGALLVPLPQGQTALVVAGSF
jgi:hypothetical protein